MDKKKIIKSILIRLQLSLMEAKEKALWTVLLPTFGDSELKRLDKILEKEVDDLMDLYLKTQKINA